MECPDSEELKDWLRESVVRSFSRKYHTNTTEIPPRSKTTGHIKYSSNKNKKEFKTKKGNKTVKISMSRPTHHKRQQQICKYIEQGIKCPYGQRCRDIHL
eukprot:TRINITY_DN12137_c0_g1_i1.p3 TRINITY_DN12137_c0_g1~~TRINITY_DN12137_c0_g1_i1.p3  ORF type:complete len:100 (+),score=8.96 TRINITY_DN12137_c0_g1_i1:66-365(+)